MRLTRGMKKVIAYALTGALVVVGGINFDMTKASAADTSFKFFANAVTGFEGDGSYEVDVASAAWSTWVADGFYNLGYFAADLPYTLSDVTLKLNDTYSFKVIDSAEAQYNESEEKYKVDLVNIWDGGDYTGTDALYTSTDSAATINKAGANTPLTLNVGDTKTDITSYKVSFTYTYTGEEGGDDVDPVEIKLSDEGVYLGWTGSWIKEGTDNTTATKYIAEGSKASINIAGGGGYWIAIDDIDLSIMENPTLEATFNANDDTAQICDPSWNELTNASDASGVFKCALSSDFSGIILTSKNASLEYTSISIYDDKAEYANVKLTNSINSTSELNKDDYTSESWEALETALAAANAITESSTVEEINAANAALKAAIAGLKKADPATGGDDPTPAPGGDDPTPAPGGDDPTPAPGGDDQTPAPGGSTPTPAPGGSTSTPVPSTTLTVKKTSVIVAAGKSASVGFTASATPTVKTSNKKVATAKVSGSNIKITVPKSATKGATAKVTVTVGSKSATITVTVQNPAKKIKAAKKTVNVKKNKKVTATFKVTATNKKKAAADTIKVTSKNKKVAKIVKYTVKKGKVTVSIKGVKKGKTTVTLKIGKKSAKVTVKVK